MKTREEYIDAVKVKIEEISPFDEPDAFIDGDPSSTVKPIISYIDKSLDEAAKNCLMTLPLTLLHADVEVITPSVSINRYGVGRTAPLAADWRLVRFRHASLGRDITAFITTEDPLYLVMQNPHCRPGTEKPVAVLSSDVDFVGDDSKCVLEIYSLRDTFPDEDISGATDQDGYAHVTSIGEPAADGFAPALFNVDADDYLHFVSETAYCRLLFINTNKKPGAASDYSPALTPQQARSQLVQSPIEHLIVLECARIVLNILKDYDGAKVCEAEAAAKIQAILK